MSGSSFFALHRTVATGAVIALLTACSGGGGGGGGFSPQANNRESGPSLAAGTKASATISASRARIANAIERGTASGRMRIMSTGTTPSNPTTANPPVTRPNETPCVVQLYSNFRFTNFTYPTFSYTPPASCPGPWAKVVLDADFAVSQGIQFDRTGSIWIAGTNIYFGTTSEPAPGYGPSWHIEKDVTDLSPIFNAPSTGEVVLGNIVNSTYTGVISSSATLSFYPVSRQYPAANAPDAVYPLSGGALGDNQYITNPTQPLTATYTLPPNVRAAYLDVYLQSQIGDEFWYTCFPSDLASQIPNCGNTAFREGDVAIDGQAAGVVPIYPWIFTGGIDPYLWQPIPGIETLNFKPYRVDLTPFAGVLSNGQPHTIDVTVFNNGNYFAANAALLVYLDHGSSRVTGGIISDTTQLDPNPTVSEDVPITNGIGKGTVSVKSFHVVSIDGYANTSQGRIETRVSQQINFSNVQQVTGNTTGSLFDQSIKQDTTVTSDTRTTDAQGNQSEVREERDWPLDVVYDFMVNADGSATQYASIAQGKHLQGSADNDNAQGNQGNTSWHSDDEINAVDTLQFPATGGFTPTNPTTSQSYRISAPGFCWNKSVSAKNGVLTSQAGGSC